MRLDRPICTACVATSCIINFSGRPLAIGTEGGKPVKNYASLERTRKVPPPYTHQAEMDEALVRPLIMLTSLRSWMVLRAWRVTGSTVCVGCPVVVAVVLAEDTVAVLVVGFAEDVAEAVAEAFTEVAGVGVEPEIVEPTKAIDPDNDIVGAEARTWPDKKRVWCKRM
jgi:hypothetical protein